MKRLVPVLAIMLLACACDSFKTQTYQDDIVMPLQGSAQDSLFYSLSLQYVTSGMLIPAMEKVNATITNYAFDLEDPKSNLDQSAICYRENLIDEYLNENEGLVGEAPILTWEDSITGEFTKPYKGWRNYIITYYCYRGGAHGSTTYNQIVFDKKTGDTVLEANLFKPGFEKPVEALMKEKAKEIIKSEDPELLEFIELTDVMPNGNFSVGPQGVQWIFQPDSILPHAFGMLSVSLSWDELKPYLAF